MAHPRCIVEKLPTVGDIAWLSKDEAKHAMGSRRLEAGDALELVDGRGGVALSTILPTRNAAGETGAQVSACHNQPRLAPEIHIASAIPKGDRLATMLDMLGQFSVASFTPLDCERGVVPADRFDGARAHRIFVEAMKQSRGAWTTQVASAHTPKSCAETCRTKNIPAFVAHPDGKPLAKLKFDQPSCMILIGPEGGFTDAEIADTLAAHAIQISLGSTTLRIETAAAMTAGFVRFYAQNQVV
ncbi:MAG: 16S rRNA (uracil(1498)-N(3))-methyltransferase [Phycisphaerales bacterium]|nr:16S rRNA (uracil(1498)-N(3))-methyltransferase [Phycisphaerales bacterium]